MMAVQKRHQENDGGYEPQTARQGQNESSKNVEANLTPNFSQEGNMQSSGANATANIEKTD